MKGTHQVIVKNRRLHFKFSIERNITIIRGDSATGKTKLIEMINEYEQNGEASGVTVLCDKPCVVLSGKHWKAVLEQIKDSIVFIDEGEEFVSSTEFAATVKNSDNYYVLVTRASLFNLSYSTKEIYGIKNTAGNKYQGTKRIYSEFYPLCKDNSDKTIRPDIVVVEDSNSGFDFFNFLCKNHNIKCISAKGNGNVYSIISTLKEENILLIVDGAAFGQQIERVMAIGKTKNIVLYLPESFEWIILKSGLIKQVEHILESPSEHIESSEYYTWERFFSKILTEKTQGTYLKYRKQSLNQNYLHEKEIEKILKVLPEIKWND